MHCARCGASAIAGSGSCYRCHAAFEEPAFSVAAPRVVPAPRVPASPPRAAPGPTPAPAARRLALPAASSGRPWAAAGFGALSLLFLADVVLLDDAPGFYMFPVGFLVLALLAWKGRARTACISIASVGLALGLFAAAGGGYLIGVSLAMGSAATLVALVLPLRARGLMTSAVERRA